MAPVTADPAGTSSIGRAADPSAVITPVAAEGAAEWDAFVASAAEATIYHRYVWRNVIDSVFGHETHYVAARSSGGEIDGVLPLVRLKSRMFGDFMVSLPYFNYGGVLARSGPIQAALLEAAAALARERGCRHLELRHREPLPPQWGARTDKVAMVLPLPPTVHEMWARLPSKMRNNALRPGRRGVTCEFGGMELLGDFYAVFSENMRDLGTPVYPLAFFRAIMTALPGNTALAIARVGGRAAAAAFMVEYAGGMEIPWGSSLRRFNKHAANNYMYGSMLERAVVRGCHSFDFGRSTIDSGTYLFKQQWGARPRQLYWHYWLRDGGELPKLRPDNPKFRAAVALWRRLPLAIANRVGPHVVKYLP